MRIGLAVRERREALGIRQEDVAKRLNMHRTYYGAIERGQKNVRLDTLERICAVLKTQMWAVMQEAEERESLSDSGGKVGRKKIGKTRPKRSAQLAQQKRVR
jgi:transcriptional regulator with XRE-family HTH domain